MSVLESVLSIVMPSKSGDPDAIEILKNDHDEVDALFKDYDDLVEGDGGDDAKRALSTQICGMLAVHAIIEEEIFYPAARSNGVDSALLNEAEIEHGSVKELIAHIGASKASDELYDARVKVLGEYVRHHVREEENELFPACRKSEMDLQQIGERLLVRKNELHRKLHGK